MQLLWWSSGNCANFFLVWRTKTFFHVWFPHPQARKNWTVPYLYRLHFKPRDFANTRSVIWRHLWLHRGDFIIYRIANVLTYLLSVLNTKLTFLCRKHVVVVETHVKSYTVFGVDRHTLFTCPACDALDTRIVLWPLGDLERTPHPLSHAPHTRHMVSTLVLLRHCSNSSSSSCSSRDSNTAELGH